jgi:hypothetical protein
VFAVPDIGLYHPPRFFGFTRTERSLKGEVMKRPLIASLAAVSLLSASPPAEAHVLTLDRARNASLDALRAFARSNPAQVTVIGVGPARTSCRRFNAHKIACLGRYFFDPAPADPDVAPQVCSRRIVVRISRRSYALLPKRFYGGGCSS